MLAQFGDRAGLAPAFLNGVNGDKERWTADFATTAISRPSGFVLVPRRSRIIYERASCHGKTRAVFRGAKNPPS